MDLSLHASFKKKIIKKKKFFVVRQLTKKKYPAILMEHSAMNDGLLAQ